MCARVVPGEGQRLVAREQHRRRAERQQHQRPGPRRRQRDGRQRDGDQVQEAERIERTAGEVEEPGEHEHRIELERLVVRQLAGKLTKSQITELNAHVDAEDRARDGTDAVSIRLATEFHILLANMTNSPILVRYVSEVAYRCCLTLSLYSRPHSSECAINEHRAIIAALVKGDESKVMGLMHSHLDSVANRALVAPAPQRGRDLLDILAPYAEEGEGGRVVKMPKVVRAR